MFTGQEVQNIEQMVDKIVPVVTGVHRGWLGQQQIRVSTGGRHRLHCIGVGGIRDTIADCTSLAKLYWFGCNQGHWLAALHWYGDTVTEWLATRNTVTG